VIELNSTIGILLPSYSREIRSGGLAACQPNPPPDGAIMDDGYAATSVRLKFFEKEKEKIIIIFIFIFFSKKFQSSPPPTKPSCTTAPPWGRGDWNATEPPTNARDRTKFINWNFTSKLFSRNQERGACSMSIQPTSGWSRRI
jgi:hypothetical protein